MVHHRDGSISEPPAPPQPAQADQTQYRAGQQKPGNAAAPVAQPVGAKLNGDHGDCKANGGLQGQGTAHHFWRACGRRHG